ncbi:MAG: McrC family protein [Eubacteriales bacterium]|nr:McrC family protein [Eubacteriales bacterium]
MKSLILQEYDNIQRDSSGSLSKKDPFRGPQKGVYTLCPDYYDELRNELLRKDNEEWDSEELRGGIVSFVKLKNHGHQEIIQIQHYVGIILLADGFQIEVLPKIDVESNTEEEKKAKLERILLRMLGYLKDFPAIPADTADLDTKKTSLYEVFIQLYLFKVLSLIHHGLRYRYVSVEENLPSFKGKLNVMSQIKYNSVRKDRFYVTHDEYRIDSPENRLIKSTLLLLSEKSSSNKNGRMSRQLLQTFETTPESRDYLADYSRITYDINNSYYHDVIEWSIAFLLGKSFVISQGSTNADSLLFPMEKIFESYIAKKLTKVLRTSPYGSQWKIKTQSTQKYLFDDPKKFQIKPDIRIFKGKGEEEQDIIFDTKWKKLDITSKRNSGISTADMYQMYAYAKRYRAKDVWLLYPHIPEENKLPYKKYQTNTDPSLKYQGTEVVLDTNVTIHIEFIDLSCLSFDNAREAEKKMDEKVTFLLEKSLDKN